MHYNWLIVKYPPQKSIHSKIATPTGAKTSVENAWGSMVMTMSEQLIQPQINSKNEKPLPIDPGFIFLLHMSFL
jgi:hypothetical protein